MTKVAILPESTEPGRITYRAIAGRQQSVGKTAGEALDALTSSLSEEASATMVIVQHQRPDEFFNAQQQARLKELMLRWREARDAGSALARCCVGRELRHLRTIAHWQAEKARRSCAGAIW